MIYFITFYGTDTIFYTLYLYKEVVMKFEDILKAAIEEEERVAQFLADIVSIRSLSGEEEEVVSRIKKEMEDVGFDSVKVDDFGNVVGTIGNGKKKIAFDAHIDVVDAGEESLWDFPPFEGRVVDDKVIGRGSSDQKAGMAAIVYAGKIIKKLGIQGDFTFYGIGSIMEEDCDGLPWTYLVEKENFRPDVVVLTEPTDLGIYRGHRGRMEIEVDVKGKSAHGAFPELGDNAIYKAAEIVLDLKSLAPHLKEHDFLGKGTLTVSRIRGNGPSLCSVADHSDIYIDRRLTLGESLELAVSEIENLKSVKRYGATVNVPVYEKKTYKGYLLPMKKYYPTWLMEEDNPILKNAENAYRGLFKEEPRVGKWTFSTNGVTISGKYGIKAFGFGPGIESLAHSPNEYCPKDHLPRAVAMYVAYLMLESGINVE